MPRLRYVLIVIPVLLATFLVRERIWTWLHDPALEPPVNFASLQPAAWPNRYLVCSRELCRHANPDADPPVYKMPARLLRQALLASVDRESNVQIIQQAEDGYYLRFLQRTPIMLFPDIIAVRIMALDADRSTLAIVSYSLIGSGDMGTNRARVGRWLSRIPG